MALELNESKAIQIGGVPQWIYIRGENRDNPLILFLHGGPGFCESPFAHIYGPQLEKYFTVIHWDQRGSNRSFSKSLPPETMTIQRLVDDTIELMTTLTKEFSKSDLTLIGHSWGSALGIMAGMKVPHLINNFFGIGLYLNGVRGEEIGHDFVLTAAKAKQDSNIIRDLSDIGRPAKDKLESMFLNVYVTMFGGNFYNPKRFDQLTEVAKAAPIGYRPEHSLRVIAKFSEDHLWRPVHELNLINLVQEIPFPCHFLHGVNDFMTPLSLVKEFLERPVFRNKKEIHVFEQCAHWPHHERTTEFVDLVKKSRL